MLASVARDGGDTVRITPERRDARRIDVFYTLTEHDQVLWSPTEGELGAATLAAVGVTPIEEDGP